MAENGGAKSPSPKKAAPKRPATASTQPKTIDMVVEAISAQTDRKGASVPSIKSYILEKYVSVDPNMLKSRLKRALEKGLESGVIVRPKGWEESGSTLVGRFRVDKTKLAGAKKEKPKPAKKPRVEEKKPKPKKTADKATTKTKTSDKTTTKTKKTDAKTKTAKMKPVKTPSKLKKVVDKPKQPKAKVINAIFL